MLLKDRNKNTEEIKRIDIALAYYIKKRAKVTKGGFNFIPKEMWNGNQFLKIDSLTTQNYKINSMPILLILVCVFLILNIFIFYLPKFLDKTFSFYLVNLHLEEYGF